ncbi:hypothetical protein H1C71_023061 [Ictidomys tridecemlineatus]|nr:hypothetical protein H1C71_023061 [Ictidomys tridecemlineatus]
MEDSNRGFQSRAVLEGPGPSTSGNELGLRAQSPESLEDTLEPDCLDEDSSFTSSTSSSSTKEETDVMWRRVMSSLIGIQRLHNPARNIHCHVYVTDHDLEYEDHHIQGFIENPEPMEGKAKCEKVWVVAVSIWGWDGAGHAEHIFQKQRRGRNNEKHSCHSLHAFWGHSQGLGLCVDL